ncbi:Hypothetical predicted protein [Paramuricea clavata]|uniref:Uncharacterized protein n=1 Tax=Paramuricea clavata TaxID=317549 RepID=A0A6S7IWK0_PARCT|nr:Hypothetical predicted protein [Paramuricea clavata]
MGGLSSRRSHRTSTINATRATQNAAPAVDLPPLATPQTSTPPVPSSGNVLSRSFRLWCQPWLLKWPGKWLRFFLPKFPVQCQLQQYLLYL